MEKKMKMKTAIKKTVITITAAAILMAGVISCRNEKDTENPKIEKLKFAEDKRTLEVGQRASVGISMTPAEARPYNTIAYSTSVNGIVEIDQANSSSEGVVFTAVKAGTVVIMARSGGVVDYLDVTVTGESEITIPYISLSENVLEIPVGKKRYAAVALQGGSPADQNNFTFTNSNDTYVYMESANNTVVLEGLKKGMSRITVGHPKAQYNTSIVAFVLNEGETAKYITGEDVVFMDVGGGTKEYVARVVGIDESYNYNTIYIVSEGNSVIEVLGTGTSCTIKPKSAGVAKVQVRNIYIPDYVFEFQVVVQQKSAVKYIKTQKNFYIINEDEYVNFTANMGGDVPDDWFEKFGFSIDSEHEGIIEVERVQNHYSVKGVKNGSAVLTLTNEYSEVNCDILFIVQNQRTIAGEEGLYIRTSQSVITMEAGKGAPDAVLKMELVGGTSADQNNFEWVVEDSSVLEVEKAPGTVSYKRSQINSPQSYEVEAILKAKKPGTTRITVSNSSPKCLNRGPGRIFGRPGHHKDERRDGQGNKRVRDRRQLFQSGADGMEKQ